jgi:hypothetical protein
MRAPTRKRSSWFLALAILLVALAVRLPTCFAGFPYLNYVDEGYVLHRSIDLLRDRTWDIGWYVYPPVPAYAVAAAATIWQPLYRAVHGHALHDDLPDRANVYYSVVDPPELVLFGRLLTLVLALGIVALAGLLAARLGGPAAGRVAMWWAALVPALVIRGGNVNVDTWAVCFSLAALLTAERSVASARPLRWAAAAGALTALAAAAKYPAGLVALPVAWRLLSAGRLGWRQRARALALAGGAGVLALFLSFPGLFLRSAKVIQDVRVERQAYADQQAGSYWDQTVSRAEWDQPTDGPELGIWLLLVSGAGLVVALANRRTAAPAVAWIVLALGLAALFAPVSFRAFRNLLVLVPLATALIGNLAATLRQRLAPGLVDVVAFVLPLVFFAPQLSAYVSDRLHLVDSRHEATRWLGAHCAPQDEVFVAQELAVLPTELDGLPCYASDLPRRRLFNQVDQVTPRFLLLGDLLPARKASLVAPQPARHGHYASRVRFGSEATPTNISYFFPNRQILEIFEWLPEPAGSRAADGAGAGRH